MDVLAVIHGETVRAGVFGDAVEERGHRLEEWSLAWGTSLPRPLDAYGAVLVFGGAMHADQEEHHPWLREESFLLQRLLGLQIPVLGVCLGAQLLARAAGAWVGPAGSAEVGWFTVEVNDDGAADPVLGALPRRVEAFQWHYYTFELPEGAVELARSEAVRQAFRLGERAWGIQFHAEVERRMLDRWFVEGASELPKPIDEVRAETDRLLGDWNEHGRALSTAFLDEAQRLASREPAAVRR
jgi:GMP synthase (glutamine-hydrolysing)